MDRAASQRASLGLAMNSEAAARADFSAIRYAQVWEDADVLLAGLDVQPGDVCVSIASAGDNALALLARNPSRVVALDLSAAQLACLELRVAAYRVLDHSALLELIGSRASDRRAELYAKCQPHLSGPVREFWDARSADIARGIGHAGKFERYFELFRTRVLPLVHSGPKVTRLLQGGTREARLRFYLEEWNTWRWRLLFRVFFSRFVMGRLGRDPAFFRYVEGSVAERILARTRHALTELDPAENPYLTWILTGTHAAALPCALRPENFEAIRANLDRLEWHRESLEEYLDTVPERTLHRFNLSDIFEYMSEENFHTLLRRIVRSAAPGARLVYWNMLAPRQRPEAMAMQLHSLGSKAAELHAQDKAFFYSAVIVEEVV